MAPRATEQISEMYPAMPAAALAALGVRYRGYHLDGFAPGVHRGLPSGMMTFIVTIDDPLDLRATPPPLDSAGVFDAIGGGLHQTPAIISHTGRQIGIHIDVPPTACSAVFGLPAAALAACTVDLAELIGTDARQLIDEVRAETTWPRRFAAVDRVLLAVQHRLGQDMPRAELQYAWRTLRASAGRHRVADVAAQIGWSRRHLQDQFSSAFGVSPKLAARLSRFESARRRLQRGEEAALVAATSGFADQSHMVREWHGFVGLSPTAWLAEEAGLVVGHDQFPFVQDVTAPVVLH